MPIATAPDTWLQSFGRLSEERTDPPWLTELRRQAMHRFVTHGLPTTRHEDWIYTNLAPLAARNFQRARAVTTPEPGTLEGHHLHALTGPRIVFVNGHFDPHLTDLDALPDGVTAVPLQQALRESPERMRSHIERLVEGGDHPFADLNTAFFEDGVVLRIGKGVDAPKPIQVVFVMKSWQNDVVEHPRLILLAEENSRATVVERYEAQGPGDRFTNAATRVDVRAGARLEHIRLQREGSSSFHVGITHVRQARDSTYESVSVSLGGTVSRHEIEVGLVEPGASCSLGGLYVLGGKEHVDNHTVVHHRVPSCTSSELYKGILGGRSRGAFTGRMVVHKDAQHTSSTQANHNLLLSDDAVADTRPQLEIYADDVQCAHGATIGQLDEDQAFYLRSRGLKPLAARNLLIHGFASEVLETVRDDEVRALLERVLESRLNVDIA